MGRKPSDRPVAIVEAAVQEFADHGFEGASWRRIAERAGVAQSLLTYHFADKEGLWRAAYRHARDRKVADNPAFPRVAPPSEGGAPDRAAVEAWLTGYVRGFARHPELSRMQVNEGRRGSARTRWAAKDSLKADYDAFEAELAKLQAHGWFAGVAPHQLVYMLVGAAQYAFLVPSHVKTLTGRDATGKAYADAHAAAVAALFMRFA